MELVLILAPTGRCVEAIHVWSEDNELADKLSRLTGESEDEIPTSLLQVSRTVWNTTTDWKIVNQLSTNDWTIDNSVCRAILKLFSI